MQRKYKNCVSLPLRSIDLESIQEITTDHYELMYEYCWRMTKNDDLAYEILHQTIDKYARHMANNPSIRVTGGLFVLVERSVRLDYIQREKRHETLASQVADNIIDDRDEAWKKYDKEIKLVIIDKALQTLTLYQRELYAYYLTTKKTELARALDVSLNVLNREIDEITQYIQRYYQREIKKHK